MRHREISLLSPEKVLEFTSKTHRVRNGRMNRKQRLFGQSTQECPTNRQTAQEFSYGRQAPIAQLRPTVQTGGKNFLPCRGSRQSRALRRVATVGAGASARLRERSFGRTSH